jgi:protein phosphatase 1K
MKSRTRFISPLPGDDKWVVISSDGLYNEETRGGGGGLDNQQVADILKSAGPDADCNKLAEALAVAAVELGSTDDITVVLLKLGTQ